MTDDTNEAIEFPLSKMAIYIKAYKKVIFWVFLILLLALLGTYKGEQFQSTLLIKVNPYAIASGLKAGEPDIFATITTNAADQIELLQSLPVLQGVTDQLKLNIRLEQQRFAFLPSKSIPAENTVLKFDVSPTLINSTFNIQVIDNNNFQLTTPDDKHYTLTFNKLHQLTLPEGKHISINIDASLASHGKQFSLQEISSNDFITTMKNKIEVEQTRFDSNIIEITYKDNSPEYPPLVLNTLAKVAKQISIDNNLTLVAKAQAFLDTKKQKLEQNIDTLFEQLNAARQNVKSIDVDKDQQHLLNSILSLDEQIAKLNADIFEGRTKYTHLNPNFQGLLAQETQLKNQKDKLSQQLYAIPSQQENIVDLERKIEAQTKFYNALVYQAESLRFANEEAFGDIQTVQLAETPSRPESPTAQQYFIAITLGSLFLGFFAAMICGIINDKLKYNGELEIADLPVIGNFPILDIKTNINKSAHKRAELNKVAFSVKQAISQDDNVIGFSALDSDRLNIAAHIANLISPSSKVLYCAFTSSATATPSTPLIQDNILDNIQPHPNFTLDQLIIPIPTESIIADTELAKLEQTLKTALNKYDGVLLHLPHINSVATQEILSKIKQRLILSVDARKINKARLAQQIAATQQLNGVQHVKLVVTHTFT